MLCSKLPIKKKRRVGSVQERSVTLSANKGGGDGVPHHLGDRDRGVKYELMVKITAVTYPFSMRPDVRCEPKICGDLL